MRLRSGILAACCTALLTATAGAAEEIAETETAPQPTGKLAGILQAFSTAMIGPMPVDQEARAAEDNADGILRITDANYEEIFAAGQPNDVWVIVATGPLADHVQATYRGTHRNASLLMRGTNETEGDVALPADGPVPVTYGDNVFHFARVDWVTDFIISTRWFLTKPPYYLFVSDNGKTIRSMWAPKTPANGEWLYFLVTKRYWEQLPVWQSSFGPGGKYAFLIESYIYLNQLWFKSTANVPRWAWLVASMFFASFVQRVVGFLHARWGAGSGAAAAPRAEVNPVRVANPKLPLPLKQRKVD